MNQEEEKTNHDRLFQPKKIKTSSFLFTNPKYHYENTPIQIYRKESPPKTESFQIKILIFFIILFKT